MREVDWILISQFLIYQGYLEVLTWCCMLTRSSNIESDVCRELLLWDYKNENFAMGTESDFLRGEFKQMGSVIERWRWIGGKFYASQIATLKPHQISTGEREKENCLCGKYSSHVKKKNAVFRCQIFAASQVIMTDLTGHSLHTQKSARLDSYPQKTTPKQFRVSNHYSSVSGIQEKAQY